MRRILASALCIMLAFSSLAIFSACDNKKSMPLEYYDQLTEGQDYNRDLFYRNDLVIKAADPSVIYVTEGDQAGYFYMYATSDEIGASGYQSWRSKDLVNWECMGVAFDPSRESWGIQNYWAPETVYYKAPNEEKGKYYMFYNAWNDYHNNRYHAIGLAVSDNPNGPFVQYTGTNTDGRVIGIKDPFLDASLFTDTNVKGKPFIDASPFVDTDGKIYLYFVLDIQGGAATSSIWGMEMKDMFTPDYSTVKQITRFGYTKVEGGDAIVQDDTNRTNEAPFVYRRGDNYYMTYSVSQYMRPDYSVGQAISTNGPLGDFEKVKAADGGHFLTYKGAPGSDELTYDHMSGTGHHSFVPVGDELFIVYHAFVDRWYGTIGQGRSIAADKVSFINNGSKDILYVNGPSYSLQPLPSAVSGYKNMITNAKITATNVVSGNGVEYLQDGIYKNHAFDYIKEFKAKDRTKITIKFGKKIKARAIMVYNAFSVSENFGKVKEIGINFDKGIASIKNLGFDPLYMFVDDNDPDEKIMRPGGSCIAEFDEILTDTITIEIDCNGTFAISDIVILGKEA